MSANRYLLRLFRFRTQVGKDLETNLDPADDSRLRELLEQQVKAERGTLQLDLSDGWRLVVLALDGGRRYASVRVDGSGRTVVKR